MYRFCPWFVLCVEKQQRCISARARYRYRSVQTCLESFGMSMRDEFGVNPFIWTGLRPLLQHLLVPFPQDHYTVP